MARRLAIIPARGGSKRLPDKNTRYFCGKPMIGHILETAIESKLFDLIHVSTEDSQVKEIVSRLGFAPDFDRPLELADDETPLMPVLRYVIKEYQDLGQEFDEIWALMPCSPLITAKDLLGAERLYRENTGRFAVMPVSSYSAPVEWAFELQHNKTLKPSDPGKFAIRSQDLIEKFHDIGAFYVLPPSMVMGSISAGNDTSYVGYHLPKRKSVDIDDEDDWELAEAIFLGTSEQ